MDDYRLCLKARDIWIFKIVLGSLFLAEFIFITFYYISQNTPHIIPYFTPHFIIGFIYTITGVSYLSAKKRKPETFFDLARKSANFSSFSRVLLIIIYIIITISLIIASSKFSNQFLFIILFSFPLFGFFVCTQEFHLKKMFRWYDNELRIKMAEEEKYNERSAYESIKQENIVRTIKQYKELYDNGLITEKEFLEKKESLLKL